MKPVNPYPPRKDRVGLEYAAVGTAWQEGADTIEDYWFSPCTEHPIKVVERFGGDVKTCLRRCDCPECLSADGKE